MGTAADFRQLSPAERYAAAAERAAFPATTDFCSRVGFQLDEFQRDACRAVERGDNVLVCAPTGAGKTVVADFAVAEAIRHRSRLFYTTPIKALSNQKYRDLVASLGADQVGLLTGDISINGRAPIVVMTTEVLRNMLYSESSDLGLLRTVVLDEVHYLADRFRGAVWEEVILRLPDSVAIIGLSATVSNAEEFGSWIRSVRGTTAVVVDEIRPVPLWQHLMVGRGLYDLYEPTVDGGGSAEHAGGPAPRQQRATNRAMERAIARQQRPEWAGSGRRDDPRGRGRVRDRWRPLPRVQVLERLDEAGLLPAIVFIFSRVGCDAALAQCAASGITLTDPEEQAQIAWIIDDRTRSLPPEDVAALELPRLREAWLRGIAAHHAGLLPAFKEVVEELFVRGLVKVVFATETLALGINMPARTVVLERLVKFDGESHADITPGEYTQLTGRAGRRGIDIEGHAVVLWAPGVDPHRVAGLASTRTFPLVSSFRPTYNMVINLVDRIGRADARAFLERSFAQFQARRQVEAKRRQADSNRKRLAELREHLTCPRGDITSYAELAAELARAQRSAASSRSERRGRAAADDFIKLRRGDVVRVDRGRRSGLAVVLDARPGRAGDVRPLVITEHAWAGRLTRADFRSGAPVLGHLNLRAQVEHGNARVRADIASALRAARLTKPPSLQAPTRDDAGSQRTSDLRAELRAHPVHGCPDLAEHLAQARSISRLAAETDELSRSVKRVDRSMADGLDRLCGVLESRGYLDGDSATDSGVVLRRLWLEADLLAAECAAAGFWANLEPAPLAAAVSGLVFESRRGIRVGAAELPSSLAPVPSRMEELWAGLVADESAAHLPASRGLDFGFARAVAGWVSGASLAECLDIAGEHDADLSAGDFVRWCRQVMDVLDQLRAAAGDSAVPAASAALRSMRRGVVALGMG